MTDYIEVAKRIMEKKLGAVAVRGLADDENYAVGDWARESYEWDYENDCSTFDTYGEDGEKAGGTCGILVKTSDINMFFDGPEELAKRLEEAVKINHYSSRKAIIAGDYFDADHDCPDEGEVRIVDAKVMEVVGE